MTLYLMARKGSQQKNGLDRNSANRKKGAPDLERASPNVKEGRNLRHGKVFGEEELPNGNQMRVTKSFSRDEIDLAGNGHKSKQQSGQFLGKEKQGGVAHSAQQSVSTDSISGDCARKIATTQGSGSGEGNEPLVNSRSSTDCRSTNFGNSVNGANAQDVLGYLEFLDTVVVKRLMASALSILKTATELLERQKPFFIHLTTNALNAACYAQEKLQCMCPIVLRWLMQLGSILLLLLMIWLDSALRGIDSFLRMGTTSFFLVIWCSVFSVITMIGVFKFSVTLVIMAIAGFLVGFTIQIILVAILGLVLLWFCGSFWTTTLVICSGGFLFALRREKLALLTITMYSTYCARAYAGWLGLLVALNLSFISSDALTFFLRNNATNDRMPHGTPEQTSGPQGQTSFSANEPDPSFSEANSGPSVDFTTGVPTTSGTDSGITSEDEVARLLNCTNHYSALGLSRHENIDVSILKREYRKKAMLVHPDKNMGNEKAADAFKKLQNAYEVLLDSVRRKAYDDELRREELLNFFHGIQNSSQRKGRHNMFGFRADGEDPSGESKRIACRKCGNFHIWIHTKKLKSTARWCQDCQDFHQAKDGDGWIEQSCQPFLFGILQKVDAPRAYVCADSRIYDATEWYICQGMSCAPNTHKPSFHVNTSLAKHNNNGSKGSGSGQRGGGSPNPPEESMSEEQFFEWLKDAVQAGVFDNFAATSGGSSSENTGSFNKTTGGGGGGGSGTGGGSSSRRRKKGKKQW